MNKIIFIQNKPQLHVTNINFISFTSFSVNGKEKHY